MSPMPTPIPTVTPKNKTIEISGLNFFYGKTQSLTNVNLDIHEKQVTAFIGPSGCGKSTLLRTLNRMYDLYPGQRAEGSVIYRGKNILDPGQDVNMLRLVPNSLLEAAFALGAPRWKVAIMVRLRAVKAGVVTGVLLALARIAGETAPLLFTALNNQFFSMNMNAPLANLPTVIYQFAMSPYDDWRSLAWGGALLVTFSVLVLNILSRTVFTQKAPT